MNESRKETLAKFKIAIAKAANESAWLNPKATLSKFKEAAKTQAFPTLDFPIGVPVFVKTIAESRVTQTRYGLSEVVDVEIIEPKHPEIAGKESPTTMWLTQEVIRTKMIKYRDSSLQKFDVQRGKKPAETVHAIPEGLELCIVNLGKIKGGSYSYFDYFVGTKEEGLAVLK